VQTDSTAWATEVRLLAATVVRRLNEALGDGTVRVVDVKGPEAPSWRHGRRSLRDARGPRDTYG
jgi:predicted nucleic acid-binding Zn ribbon protein